MRAGIDEALRRHALASLSIDTWGVDYVLLHGGEAIPPAYAYRDGRTREVIDEVHARIPFAELYRRTGCQFQPFNSLYQLCADAKAGRLRDADGFLMIPEYLMYRLCGAKAREYTNATTTGLVSARTGQYDMDIVRALGLPERLFGPLIPPGTALGTYRGVRVMLCATHDTASAVEGMPVGEDDLYLSSGTWSLLGAKVPRPLTDDRSREANWSNEGGVGYIRYQKNIMGMWLVNRLREELCPDMPWDAILAGAEADGFDALVDVNDPAFMAPRRMTEAFDACLPEPPPGLFGYFRCACRSLARGYQQAIGEIERNTGRSYGGLCIVGGGARNGFLNRLTEQAIGKPVTALPIEATAIGNLKIQMREGG